MYQPARGTRSRGLVCVVVGLLVVCGHAVIVAQAVSAPDREPDANARARRWFEDAKLGMFVHWGVYSLLGKGEWVMNNDKIPIAEYEKLPPRFNPVKFGADEWVKLARSAGM